MTDDIFLDLDKALLEGYFYFLDNGLDKETYLKMIEEAEASDILDDDIVDTILECYELNEAITNKKDMKFYDKYKNKVLDKLAKDLKFGTMKQRLISAGLYIAGFTGGIAGLILGVLSGTSNTAWAGTIAGFTGIFGGSIAGTVVGGPSGPKFEYASSEILAILAVKAIRDTKRYSRLKEISSNFNDAIVRFKNNPTPEVKKEIKELYKQFRKELADSKMIPDLRKIIDDNSYEITVQGRSMIKYNFEDMLEAIGAREDHVKTPYGYVKLMKTEEHYQELIRERFIAFTKNLPPENMNFANSVNTTGKVNLIYLVGDKKLNNAIYSALAKIETNNEDFLVSIHDNSMHVEIEYADNVQKKNIDDFKLDCMKNITKMLSSKKNAIVIADGRGWVKEAQKKILAKQKRLSNK